MTQQQNLIQKEISTLAERFREPWFPQKDDVPWKQWVDFGHREISDLRELLKEDVRDSLKARVLFLLLMPSSSCNPFYWGSGGNLNIVPDPANFLKELSASADLLKFVLELAIEFRKILVENADLIEKKSSGGEYDTFYFYCYNAIFQYDKYLLELLALLPAKDKELIFEIYPLIEPISYNNEDCASCGPERSRYLPFERLLERTDIEKEWKYRADAKMREIILGEISGKKKPREEWEDALSCYKMILGYQPTKHYSKRLFVKQVEFLVAQAMATARYELIGTLTLKKFFSVLTGGRYKSMRYQLAQYFVASVASEKLDLYCDDTGFKLAKMILAEFGEKHEDIKIVLEKAMERRRETLAEIENRNQKQLKCLNDILEQMK